MKPRKLALILLWILGSSLYYYFFNRPGSLRLGEDIVISIIVGPIFPAVLWAWAAFVGLFIAMVRHTIRKLEE